MRALLPIVGGLVLYLVWQGRARASVNAPSPGGGLGVEWDWMNVLSPIYTPPASSRPYAFLFDAAEVRYGLPRYLLYRQAQKESAFNPRALNSRSGAQGIMQIMPATARQPGYGVSPITDPYDPAQAIPFAAAYLRGLYNTFGTWSKALAAYNWGPGNVTRVTSGGNPDWLDHTPPETQDYVAVITRDISGA